MQIIEPVSTVQFEFTPVSNQHYALDLQFQIDQEHVKQIKKHQYVMIAIQCRSGLETQNFRSLKSAILHLIYELKQRHVRQVGLFWNDHVFEVGTRSNKEISQYVDQIAQEGKKGQEEQFSYTSTLMSLRHKITNIEKSLTDRYQLFVFFLSTQLALSQILEDESWEQAYMKWLYARNKHKQDILEQENKLRNKMRSLPCRNIIYSVGYGKYHDSDILQRMVDISKSRGNYFSALSINQLTGIFDMLAILGSGQITSLYVSLKLNFDRNYYFSLQSDQKNRVFRRRQGFEFIEKPMGIRLINTQNKQYLRECLVGIPLENYKIEIVEKMLGDQLEYIDLRLHYINFLLYKMLVDLRKVIVIERIKDVTNENKYIYVQHFDEYLLGELCNEKQNIKFMFEQTDEMIKSIKMSKKAQLMDRTNNIRDLIISVEQVFANIYKKKFSYIEIGQLIGQASKVSLKRSLRKKLLQRINANPNLLADAYQSINRSLNQMSYIDVDAKYSHYLKQIGNCKYTGNNFVKSMFNQDCLAVAFSIHRPKAAIADPGRIKVRNVFHYPVSTANYISDYRMRNRIRKETYQNQNESFVDQSMGLRWKVVGDTVVYYSKPGATFNTRIEETQNDYDQFASEKVGILPLYICEENWKIARELMKPALGWTVCDEPLAYVTSQVQIVPFLVLQAFITEDQNLKYTCDELDRKIEQFLEKREKLKTVWKALDGVESKEDITPENMQILLTHYSQNKFNRLKLKQIRNDLMKNLSQHNQKQHQLKQTAMNQIKKMMQINTRYLRLVEETCNKIINQLSGPYAQLPFNKHIADRYKQYKDPINRTVDVIPNNFAFMAQLYCIIQSKFMEKPQQENFHYFFQRLVEEELRRQTDAWKQEYVEECFINKLLNVEIEKIDHPTIVSVGSTYSEKFYEAAKGNSLKMNEIKQKRQLIQLNIRKQNTFNQVQRMALIEYKRLYESTALRLWYTRFRLYQEIERKSIHKWKSIGMNNSYFIFTMLIQNKTQRKNARRREVILAGDYVDPFDYEACVEFIEKTFYELREKVIRRNMQETVARIFNNDVDAFVETSDPIEAAGVLLENTIGNKISKFFEGLKHTHSPIIHLKLNMILTGHYQDVQLFTHSTGWIMSRKKMRELERKYPHEIEKYRFMV